MTTARMLEFISFYYFKKFWTILNFFFKLYLLHFFLNQIYINHNKICLQANFFLNFEIKNFYLTLQIYFDCFFFQNFEFNDFSFQNFEFKGLKVKQKFTFLFLCWFNFFFNFLSIFSLTELMLFYFLYNLIRF